MNERHKHADLIHAWAEQLSDFDLAEKLFLAWQTTKHAEHDGEHTFKDLGGFNESYIQAWIAVAKEARFVLTPNAETNTRA